MVAAGLSQLKLLHHVVILNTLGVPCCLTLCYRNPRVASLRLAERHNTRGFRRPQTRVRLLLTSGLVLLSLLEWVFVNYKGFDAPYGVESGGSPSRRGGHFFWFWSLKFAQVGTIFAFFRICSAFFGFPHSSWLFPSICFHFCRFFFDFSSIWQVLKRFFDDF